MMSSDPAAEDEEEYDYYGPSDSDDDDYYDSPNLSTSPSPLPLPSTADLPALDTFRNDWLSSLNLSSSLSNRVLAPDHLLRFLAEESLLKRVLNELTRVELSRVVRVCRRLYEVGMKTLVKDVTIWDEKGLKSFGELLRQREEMRASTKRTKIAFGDLCHILSHQPRIAATIEELYSEQNAQERDYYWTDELRTTYALGEKKWERTLRASIGKKVGKEEWEESRWREALGEIMGARWNKQWKGEVGQYLKNAFGGMFRLRRTPTEGEEERDKFSLEDLRLDIIQALVRHSNVFTSSTLHLTYPISRFPSHFFRLLSTHSTRSIKLDGQKPTWWDGNLEALKMSFEIAETKVMMRMDGKGIEYLPKTVKEIEMDRLEFVWSERTEPSGESWEIEKCALEEVKFSTTSTDVSLYTFLGNTSGHLTHLTLVSIAGLSLTEVWETVKSHSSSLRLLHLRDIGIDTTFRKSSEHPVLLHSPLARKRLERNDEQEALEEGSRTEWEEQTLSMEQTRWMSDEASSALASCHQLRSLTLVDSPPAVDDSYSHNLVIGSFPITIIDHLLSLQPSHLSHISLQLAVDPAMKWEDYIEYEGRIGAVRRWSTLKECRVKVEMGMDAEMEKMIRQERVEMLRRFRGGVKAGDGTGVVQQGDEAADGVGQHVEETEDVKSGSTVGVLSVK